MVLLRENSGENAKYAIRLSAKATVAKKVLCILFYAMAKGSFRRLGHLLNTHHTLVYRWIREYGESLPAALPRWSSMRCGILSVKKKKLWGIKAVDRGTRRTVDWVLVRRDASTFRRLYNRVKHLSDCTLYTDGWEVFEKVLPSQRHVSGKEHTGCIERDNSNTRHHLARFTRRTKVVSKCEKMVDLSLRIWHAITTPEAFQGLQKKIVSIFKETLS